ncbi:unnamed protein product [Vitrella brassicaformis CCMP3155]|uniref:Uncharacterized protein n=2 Tax=Vitrella brassicaformis TaxID=1169539 RepID=A0A0G4G3P7_VITBC|nr:unnamed protein product [Vitrella brassicaformis CCMP3155]|eukprot:CEM22572.1 unnamed protein product [Vitrella brassicaformis CCMP3155]
MPIDPTWFLGKRTGGDPPPLPELCSGTVSLTKLNMTELMKDRQNMYRTIKQCLDSYTNDFVRVQEVKRILHERAHLQGNYEGTLRDPPAKQTSSVSRYSRKT